MNAKLIQVIATEHCRGIGTPDDPCRRVIGYHSPDGELLAEVDPCKNLTAEKESTTVTKSEAVTLVDRNPALENVLAKLRSLVHPDCSMFRDDTPVEVMSYPRIEILTFGDLRRWVESEKEAGK